MSDIGDQIERGGGGPEWQQGCQRCASYREQIEALLKQRDELAANLDAPAGRAT